MAAGVKEGPLLDAGTLDVAVIGNDKAARVFVGAPAPIAVGRHCQHSRQQLEMADVVGFGTCDRVPSGDVVFDLAKDFMIS